MHFFVDETKAKGYVMVSVACPDRSLTTARRAVGNLVLPGQRTIHMKNESPRRRAHIADEVCKLESSVISATVLDAGRGPDPEVIRRDRALRALVAMVAGQSAANLVIDMDETLVKRDARTLTAAIRHVGSGAIVYSHQTFGSQPLLALPDVIAWCWARGGDWRRRVAPIITSSIDL